MNDVATLTMLKNDAVVRTIDFGIIVDNDGDDSDGDGDDDGDDGGDDGDDCTSNVDR